ncbi:MAG: tRNA (guanosine(46)-N7)-methyltransferase TrmB [Gammaproteobacteria bacterium]|nr:tRNA (guanosine(46)-N7)-methyltransferase TrmB [Gammaproteobacteria bacterium]
MESQKHFRKVRSFVRRERRFTLEQQRAMDELMPRFGLIPGDSVFDLEQVFGRGGECHLEIGFGNGASLLAMAQANPERNYLGIEVHRPGVCNLLLEIEKADINNIRVINADAMEVLTHNLADAALDAVYLFFPDPWHKTRHHKRRLVQMPFVEMVYRRLKPGGILHMATDWEHYAKHMLSVVSQVNGFTNLATNGQFCERPAYRLLTRFEQRGLRLGHGVWDLLFKKNV